MNQIITFYSYKGGVGRTFALANIAVLLAKRGHRVLIMDWDLEAPGLHRYFKSYLPTPSKTGGVIHLLTQASTNPEVNWQSFVEDIQIQEGLVLSLISSGDRAPDYTEQVQKFSWNDFFEKYQGGKTLDRLRNEWKHTFDYVLLDSRTGITDVGGVCTVFLPDIVVFVFSANEQSLGCGVQVIAGMQDARRRLQVSRPPAAVLPLVGRFDGRDEIDEARKWMERFEQELKPFYDDWLPKGVRPKQILEVTKIPYITKFSFGEPLPVISHGVTDPELPGFYLDNAARLLVSDFQATGRILGLDPTNVEDISGSERMSLPGEVFRPKSSHSAVPAVFLPSKPANFVGRQEYLEKLRTALLIEGGMVLLSGEPGIGKSSIAQMFAWQVHKQFDAVVFQTCGQRTMETIIGELAHTLKEVIGTHIIQLPMEECLRFIKDWLRKRRSLVILDDVWIDDDFGKSSNLKLQDLLPGPRVSVLFTSRRPTLPWVQAENRLRVEAFSLEEVKETFRLYLGAETLQRYEQELLQFGAAVEYLPIALVVGAQLLQSEFGPLDETARKIRLKQLRNDFGDVPGLLQRAIESQEKMEHSLLMAAAVCRSEGWWLPLAARIAGLDSSHAASARDHLVNAGLLRVVDRDRQRFQLHSLLREQLNNDSTVDKYRDSHAIAVTELFLHWEVRWRDCRECLAEIPPAIEFLLSTDLANVWSLSSHAYKCASRIGELETALQIEQQQERLWAHGVDQQALSYLQAAYGNQALVLKAWGRMDESMDLLKKQQAICVKLGNKEGLQASYGNQALILKAWGRLDESMDLLKKQQAICVELGNQEGLQASYGNQALILHDRGQMKEAMDLLKRQEAICLELGNKDSLQRSYGNQGLILKYWGRLEEAMYLHKKEEAACLELGNKDSLQRSYGNQGLILQDWKRLNEAMDLLKKQEAISLELGNKDSLQIGYGSQALILKDQGRLNEAMDLLKKQEAICVELGNKEFLQSSYGNQALILEHWGRLDEAMDLLKKQDVICLELGKQKPLAIQLRQPGEGSVGFGELEPA